MKNQEESISGSVLGATPNNFSRRQVLAGAGLVGAVAPLSSIFGADLANAAPRAGGTMRLGVPFGAASTNDPHISPPGTQDVIRNFNVFNLLYWYNPDGSALPMLASSCESNATATIWTLKLKSGVTFHDGSALTVDDVIFSLKRIADPKTVAEGRTAIGMIDTDNLKKVNDLTLTIPLKFAYSTLPYQFATKGISILKNGTTSFTVPNGTGAFKFISGDAQKVVLGRNPNAWQGSGRPYIDKLEIIKVADAAARLNGLKSGALDTIYPTTSADVTAVKSDRKIKVFTSTTGTIMPLLVNCAVKPFNDPNVRLAMKLAADRTMMNKVSYDRKGIIGNDMFGIFDSGYPALPQRQYDPEKAAGLWKKAGLVGKRFELLTADIWPSQVAHSVTYAQRAARAKIDIDVVKIPADQYFSKGYGVGGFHNEYWVYRPVLSLWNECFNLTSGDYKYTSWSSDANTKLFKAASAEGDPKKRDDITKEMMTNFYDDGPYITWAHEASTNLYGPRVKGQENNPVRGLNGFDFSGFYLTN